MNEASENAMLQARVRSLEEKVQALRASRRVLMSLITAQEKAAKAKINHLEQENKRLQLRNHRFAKAMWQRRSQLKVYGGEHEEPAQASDGTVLLIRR